MGTEGRGQVIGREGERVLKERTGKVGHFRGKVEA